jgi:hypothetical protein
VGLEASGPGLAPPEWVKYAIQPDQFRDCEQIAVDKEEMGIYMHQAAFDSASPLTTKLRDGAVLDSHQKPIQQSWNGPETVGPMWLMSVASPVCREHFLRQARWIWDCFNQTRSSLMRALMATATTSALAMLSACRKYMIRLQQELRRLVRSFVNDKRLFTSDCAGQASFCERTASPAIMKISGVRGIAKFLCDTSLPWAIKVGCHVSWRGVEWWDFQMDLARKTGAGVSLSNMAGSNTQGSPP